MFQLATQSKLLRIKDKKYYIIAFLENILLLYLKDAFNWDKINKYKKI
jgi:hypothetical protein